jgi:DNA-binding CsgD family transcriptional regulator
MEKTKTAKLAPAESEVGLVLFDQSLRPIAFDRGAAGILRYPDPPNGARAELADYIPREIWDLVGRPKSTVQSGPGTRIHAGESEYLCRAHLVEFSSESCSIVALHMEKVWSANEVVQEIGSKFQFTNREREVLARTSKGFSSNEIAAQLHISPNTVRSFVRLIMTKMGVATRSEIVAAVLQPHTRPQPEDKEKA